MLPVSVVVIDARNVDVERTLCKVADAVLVVVAGQGLGHPEHGICVYLPVCGGGCGSVSYNQSKTYHAPGCFKTKGVVEKQILHFVNEKIKTNVEVKK